MLDADSGPAHEVGSIIEELVPKFALDDDAAADPDVGEGKKAPEKKGCTKEEELADAMKENNGEKECGGACGGVSIMILRELVSSFKSIFFEAC